MKKRLSIIFIIIMVLMLMSTMVFATGTKDVDLEKAEGAGYTVYGVSVFRDGLATVITESGWNYIDENYKLVDLNKGRFTYVYPFFEGLAAVLDSEDNLGYINKSGDIVIPCQYGEYSRHGLIYTGYFKNGVATVFKESYFTQMYTSPDMKVAKIDKSGKIVKPYWDYGNDITGLYTISDGGNIDESAEIVKQEPQPQPIQEKVTALPLNANVLVNGKDIIFEAYNIGGNNYFKLRDIALVVSGTEKQFGVEWDGVKQAINLTSNGIYKIVNGELVKGDGIKKIGIVNVSPIYKDGVKVNLAAFNINGNNYFKLRDLAKEFNIGITWNNTAKTIGIDTTIGYIAE